MTFAILRALHAIIGNAIDDVERVYAAHGDQLPSESAQYTPAIPLSPTLASPQEPTFSSTSRPGHGSLRSTSHVYASPPPSPSITTTHDSGHDSLQPPFSYKCSPRIDFPALDQPYDPESLSESLTSDPIVLGAILRIVAAAGQLSATVQVPFLSLCDAAMGYHLPSCMRLLEASHVVEILKEAGPGGLHVHAISEKNGVDPCKLAHILRLLATHHFLREVSPDVFTLNRLSSLVDSGKTFAEIKQYEDEGRPELKYRDTNGTAAFVGLCTDECQKASAYLTEAYYLSPSKKTREGRDHTRAPFSFAFDTLKTRTGYFGWLEGQTSAATDILTEDDEDIGVEKGPSIVTKRIGSHTPNVHSKRPDRLDVPQQSDRGVSPSSQTSNDSEALSVSENVKENSNRFRLERFGKAMTGTEGWEAPGAILQGFDWHSLPYGSTIVDVGGGIGSSSMLLASVFSATRSDAADHASMEGKPEALAFKFVVQDRPVVCEMGEKAWKDKCPELLDTVAQFQVHDFFTPQPVKNAALFLLRVVLHDWPDSLARKILLRLREAATPDTKLLIADFVQPLACIDSDVLGSSNETAPDVASAKVDPIQEAVAEDKARLEPISNSQSIANTPSSSFASSAHHDPKPKTGLEDIQGAESTLAPAPLLPNLGKASANVYWMDMTMQTMFNAQERTLREMVNLASSAGWKITRVSRTPGSLFGYMVAIPVEIPPQPAEEDVPSREETKDRSTAAASPQDPVSQQFGKKAKKVYDGLDVDSRRKARMLEEERKYREELKTAERAGSRCGTPTFGSRMRLSSVEEAFTRFNGRMMRSKTTTPGLSSNSGSGVSAVTGHSVKPTSLRANTSLPPLNTHMRAMRKKPSPLSVPPPHPPQGHAAAYQQGHGQFLPHSPPPTASLSGMSSPARKLSVPDSASPSPRRTAFLHVPPGSTAAVGTTATPSSRPGGTRTIRRGVSMANLRSPSQAQGRVSRPGSPPPPVPLNKTLFPPPSPIAQRAVSLPQAGKTLPRRASHAHLSQVAGSSASSSTTRMPSSPSFIPVRFSSSSRLTATSPRPDGPKSMSSSVSGKHMRTPGSTSATFASGSRNVPRRPSMAQFAEPLQPIPLRKRAGTVHVSSQPRHEENLLVSSQREPFLSQSLSSRLVNSASKSPSEMGGLLQAAFGEDEDGTGSFRSSTVISREPSPTPPGASMQTGSIPSVLIQSAESVQGLSSMLDQDSAPVVENSVSVRHFAARFEGRSRKLSGLS
ncbi:hypothetical protein CVT24_006347 [Panaeolus cyanescens]|uniref:O-methyltransferase C-terminal domain-containing protein n=1 Tax=Panaeolus cyanescens TaxID=181874 RepID=A0A409YEA4_9AGAR|nr:hypothetical protein CVT24_006347 [Panaeolus cyanescens]